MKGTTARISTHFFNFRLFLEGLKRLRVIGLATAILAITAAALVPLVFWIDQVSLLQTDMYRIESQILCVPAGFVALLAPFFFFSLFSFLQKRKESDFFHAIPYTRTCVYVSFIASALTFVFAIQLACGLVAGVLWSMIPRIAVDLGAMVAYVFISMLAAALLSSFMMLALTVSGTEGSCVLLFILFASFVRVIAAIFLGCLDVLFILPTSDMWDHSILSPLWFLPISVLIYLGDPLMASGVMYSLANILYSLAVTVLLFTLSGFIYKHRRSEMAGNPAPGKTTQALFRIMITTLPALLLPLLLTLGSEPALFLVLVVCILLVYFLYELITTKRPRNMLKAVPGLGIVAVICLVFSMVFLGYRSLVLHEKITAEEVKTVSVKSGGYGAVTYQGRLIDTLHTDDPEIIRTVVDQLALSQKYEREGFSDQDEMSQDYWNRMTVTLRLRGGRTVTRRIMMSESAEETIQNRYAYLDEVSEVLYLLPTDGEIDTAGCEIGCDGVRYEYLHMENEGELRAVMESFRREFDALTDGQKREVMAPTFDSFGSNEDEEADICLFLRGTVKGLNQRFSSEYRVIDAMPETRRLLVGLWGIMNRDANHYESDEGTCGGHMDSVLDMLGNDMADPDFAENFESLKGNVTLIGLSAANRDSSLNTSYCLDAKDYGRFVELLSAAVLVDRETTPESFSLTEHTYSLTLFSEPDTKNNRLYFHLAGPVHLTPDAYRELLEILQIPE